MNENNNKKCEGFDHIPVNVLAASKPIIIKNLTELFQKTYATSKLPDQWKVIKIVPTFKKGNKVEIENYRPKANICSTSKIFERLILNQIHYLKSKNKLNLTGKQQHGFKRSKSTATAGIVRKILCV